MPLLHPCKPLSLLNSSLQLSNFTTLDNTIKNGSLIRSPRNPCSKTSDSITGCAKTLAFPSNSSIWRRIHAVFCSQNDVSEKFSETHLLEQPDKEGVQGVEEIGLDYLLCDMEKDAKEFMARGEMGIVRNDDAMSGELVPGRPVVEPGTVLFAEVLGRMLSGRPCCRLDGSSGGLLGIDGLLHISKISRRQITCVSDHLTVDKKVKVLVVKSLFPDKIALSIADLESEPGLFTSNKEKAFSEAEEMAKK